MPCFSHRSGEDMQLVVPIHEGPTRGRSAGRGVTAVSESRTGQGWPSGIHPRPHLSSLLRMRSSRAIIRVDVVRNTTSLDRPFRSRCQEMGFLAQSGMICQSPQGSTAIFSHLRRTSFLVDFCPRLHPEFNITNHGVLPSQWKSGAAWCLVAPEYTVQYSAIDMSLTIDSNRCAGLGPACFAGPGWRLPQARAPSRDFQGIGSSIQAGGSGRQWLEPSQASQ